MVLFSGKFKLGKRPLHAERREGPENFESLGGSKMTLIALTNNYSNNGVVPVVDLTLATLADMGQED